MLYLNFDGLDAYEKAEHLTLTSVVFEYFIPYSNYVRRTYLTLTSVVFE